MLAPLLVPALLNGKDDAVGKTCGVQAGLSSAWESTHDANGNGHCGSWLVHGFYGVTATNPPEPTPLDKLCWLLQRQAGTRAFAGGISH